MLEPAFGVLYGDSYLPAPLREAWDDFDAPTGGRADDRVPQRGTRWDATNAQLEGGMVVRYEKGLDDPASAGMRHIDYGFSILDRDAVIAPLPAGEVIDLADVLSRLSAAGRLAGHEVTERFYEVGSPEGLAELDAMLGPPSAGVSQMVTDTLVQDSADDPSSSSRSETSRIPSSRSSSRRSTRR